MKKFFAFVTIISSMLFSSTTQANIPKDASNFNDHHYKVYDMKMTWEEAEKFCENKGGHLVTITSYEENKFVTDLIVNGGKNCYWIGCKLNSLNKMTWISEENMIYSNWDTNEPDNYQGKQGYAFISGKQIGNRDMIGKWGDIQNDGESWDQYYFWGANNFGFVCEWESKNIKNFYKDTFSANV